MLRNKITDKPINCGQNHIDLNIFQIAWYFKLPQILRAAQDIPGDFIKAIGLLLNIALFILLFPLLPFIGAIVLKIKAKKEAKLLHEIRRAGNE